MIIVSIILGVFMILAGLSCLFHPLLTVLTTGYYLGFLFLVYGIVALLRGITSRKAKPLGIVTDILAVIVGIIAIIRPGSTLAIDRILLYLVAVWFLVEGICSIIISVQAKSEVKGWYWGLISGILGFIAGMICLFHPLLTALAAGSLIGICFLQAGIEMAVFSAFYRPDAN